MSGNQARVIVLRMSPREADGGVVAGNTLVAKRYTAGKLRIRTPGKPLMPVLRSGEG
ncbi:MAG TPA: hypothetical protein P5013_05650 [Methanoregula sp.]|nr:hypothetical protein [Methanoregula sp.]